jgi:hypothetical protein
MYHAEKVLTVLTENAPTWMIERDRLTINAPTLARQQGVSGAPVVREEAVQELAKQTVREAGIAQDPAEGQLLETDKAYLELFKALLLINTALLAGLGTMVGLVPEADHLYTTRGAVVGSLSSAGLAMIGLATATGIVGTASDEHPTPQERTLPPIHREPSLAAADRCVVPALGNSVRRGAGVLVWRGSAPFRRSKLIVRPRGIATWLTPQESSLERFCCS